MNIFQRHHKNERLFRCRACRRKCLDKDTYVVFELQTVALEISKTSPIVRNISFLSHRNLWDPDSYCFRIKRYF